MSEGTVHPFTQRPRRKSRKAQQETEPETTCSTCMFSVVQVSEGDGEQPMLKCRRYPPQLFVLDGDVYQCYPEADDWCGEYIRAAD